MMYPVSAEEERAIRQEERNLRWILVLSLVMLLGVVSLMVNGSMTIALVVALFATFLASFTVYLRFKGVGNGLGAVELTVTMMALMTGTFLLGALVSISAFHL